MKGKIILVLKKDFIFFTREGIFPYFFQVEVINEALDADTNRGKTIGGTLYLSKEDTESPPYLAYS